jgi:hypothetical protein
MKRKRQINVSLSEMEKESFNLHGRNDFLFFGQEPNFAKDILDFD